MKRLIIIALVVCFGASFVYAGKEVVTPSVLLLNTDKGELIKAEFIWGATPGLNTCKVTYIIWNNDRTEIYKIVTFIIDGADFDALVSGYGATMESRLEVETWQDIQNRWELVQ